MSDSALYPQGLGMVKSRYVNGVLVLPGIPRHLRVRATAAQINAGLVVLPALPGFMNSRTTTSTLGGGVV